MFRTINLRQAGLPAESEDKKMNEFAAEEYKEAVSEEREGFVIDSLDKAAWAFKKIAACNARIEEVKSCVDSEREKLDTWYERETKAAKETIDYFKQLLAEYYFTEKDKNKDFKLSTPYGSGYSRKQQPELNYSEDAADRLEELGYEACIRTKKEINKTALKEMLTITKDNRAVTEDGEVLDFIEVVPREPSFTLKGV